MIQTRKNENWNVPEGKAIQQCADSRLGRYYGPYFWIIADSNVPGMKHMLATENTFEAVNCHNCQYKSKCEYGAGLSGPMITVEEMVAKRAGKPLKIVKKEISFFHQIKAMKVARIEEICNSFKHDCSQCPLAVHKDDRYSDNNHLCITGMSLYAFLSQLDQTGSYINLTIND